MAGIISLPSVARVGWPWGGGLSYSRLTFIMLAMRIGPSTRNSTGHSPLKRKLRCPPLALPQHILFLLIVILLIISNAFMCKFRR